MGVTTGVVVYKMLKQNNDCTDYTKRRGVCLDLVVVTILLYTIVTGCIKKALIIYAVCMLPWVFVPFIGSIEFVLLYGGGAAIVGAVGWFIILGLTLVTLVMRYSPFYTYILLITIISRGIIIHTGHLFQGLRKDKTVCILLLNNRLNTCQKMIIVPSKNSVISQRI